MDERVNYKKTVILINEYLKSFFVKHIVLIFSLENMIRLSAWHIKFEKRKALWKELNEQLMLIAWHPRRCWIFCMSEDKEKKNRTNFYWVMLLVHQCSVEFRSIETFWHRKLCLKTLYSSKFFLSNFFETFCPNIYIRKYLKQFSTERLDINQNFSCLVFWDLLSRNIY